MNEELAPWESGNIDLKKRAQNPISNLDGTQSTIRSIGIDADGKYYNIPTVVNGKVVSNADAIDQFKKTGQFLSVHANREEGDKAATQLHLNQEKMMNETAPWETPQKAPPRKDNFSIIQEMHPDIKTKLLGMDTGMSYDRALVKNFANSPESTVAYLKQEHPHMQVLNHNGQIIMRNPGEKDYRVLDPDTGFFSKDFINDTGDVAYDIASGIPVNMAQKLGGAMGSILPGPGTLAGAAALGGSANAANEYLRQRLGKALGIPQEVNPSDVKFAGAIGALSPIVMGNDLATPAVRDSIKAGVSKLPEFAQQFLKPMGEQEARQASEGLIKRGLIKAGSWGSGIPADALREGYNRLAGIKQFEKDGVTDYVNSVHDDIKTAFHEQKQTVGKGIQDLIDKHGEQIDLGTTKEKLKGLITEYEQSAKELDTPGMNEKVQQLKDAYTNLFGESKAAVTKSSPTGILDEAGRPIMRDMEVSPAKSEVSKVGAKAAFELQQQLADLADAQHTSTGVMSKNAKQAVADKRLGDAANGAYKELKGAIEKSIDSSTNGEINDQLMAKIKGMGPAGENLTPDAVAKMREGVAKDFKLLKDHKADYAELSQIQREIAPKFSTPEKTYNTLRTLDGKSKQYFLETLGRMDKKLGTNTVDNAKTLHAFSLLSNATTNPISGQAVTSTSKTIPLAMLGSSLGYFAGANAGLGMGGAGLGMGLGGFLGAKAGSPAAMRAAMEVGQVGSKALKRVPDFTKQSIWNLMHNQGVAP